MLQLSSSRVYLALTPALAGRSKRLPSQRFSRCYHSLLRSAPTTIISYQGKGVQRTKLVTTCSRNMSLLSSVMMRGNPGATGCDLAHVSQLLHRPGHVRFTTDLDNHNVQQVPISEDERTRFQAQLQLLEAGSIVLNSEHIRVINRIIDQSMTELEALGKEIDAGEQFLHSLKNDELKDAVLNEFPLLASNIQDVMTRNEKSQAVVDYLANQVKVRKEKEQTFAQFSALVLAGIAVGSNTLEGQLAEIRTRLQSSGKFSSSESSPIGKEPDPKRKARWIKLNEILERHPRKSKTKDSTACSYVTWDQVKYVFNPKIYAQPQRHIDDETMDFLERYLSMTTKCLPFLFPRVYARRLHVIAPILICVCNLFDGDVDIVVGEDLVGNVVKAHGHFEFMLRRGNKAVCITHVKQDYLTEGIAQALVGCEVAAELGELDIVYGIVTNYIQWSFLRSLNDKVEMDPCVLEQTRDGPKRESLKEIAEKIYSMLSS